MYILTRNNKHYFRMKVPPDLRPVFGSTEIKRSLETYDYQKACIKASLLGYNIREIMTKARREVPDIKTIRKQVDDLVRQHIEQTLESDECERIMDTEPVNADFRENHAEVLKMIRELTKNKLAANDMSWITETVDNLLISKGISMDKSSPAYRMLCREMLKAEDYITGVIESRHSGDYGDDPQFSPKPSMVVETEPEVNDNGPKPGPAGSISLGDLADQYEKGQQGAGWGAPAAGNKWAGFKKIFFRFHDPETPAHMITRKVFYEYRELLRCLPQRFMITKKYDGMSADDVKALDVPNPLHPKTVNQHIIFLGGMFKLGVNLEHITSNPAKDMLLDIKEDARLLRDVFTVDELSMIFKSPILMNANKPYQFWVTVLSLFAGARREELCNLYRDDIKQEDGIWYIDIAANRPDKRVKTYQISGLRHTRYAECRFIPLCWIWAS